MKPIIAITRPINEFIKPLIESDKYDIRVFKENRPPQKNELIKLVEGVDVIISLLTDKIDGDVINAAGTNLKLVANYAVGFDNIDIKTATNKGIAVTNTPDASSQAVAEHTMALILATAKRIVESDEYFRSGKFKFWDPKLFLGVQLGGKTLGIIGCGRIGNLVAQYCYHGLGMKILYNDICKNHDLERLTHAYQTSLVKLLEMSDIISLHVPLLPSTRHMIGKEEFAKMKKNAILINTARGAIVDEKALISALKNKIIFGAGIDVVEDESKLNPKFKSLENIIITPHIASATTEARAEMGKMVVQNVEAVLENKVPLGLVNIELRSIFQEEM